MSAESKRCLLEFYPFSSMIDSSFWKELQGIKLDHLGLKTVPIEITATFRPEILDVTSKNSTGRSFLFPHAVSLNYQSFQRQHSSEAVSPRDESDDQVLIRGQLQISNTLEDFKSSNKKTVLSNYAKDMWNALINREMAEQVDTNLADYLIRFLFLTFADLKKYHYYYWCAFPAMNYPQSCFKLIPQPEKVESLFSLPEVERIVESYSQLNMHNKMFFLVIKSAADDGSSTTKLLGFKNFWTLDNIRHLESLKSYSVYFAFTDSSRKPNKYGWILRNYIAYLFVRLSQLSANLQKEPAVSTFLAKVGFATHLKVLAFRISEKLLSRKSDLMPKIVEELLHESILLKLTLGKLSSPSSSNQSLIPIEGSSELDAQQMLQRQEDFFGPIRAEIDVSSDFLPPFVGYEFNEQLGKYLPKFVDCSRQLDPTLLASDAVHLNLKLMKWRLLPEIDLDLVRNTKCLLLGSGTLGCNIGRTLVAWGVSKITFVDSGTVSYSNPVRQTLFNFEDCLPDKDGNFKPKAVTAAEALKRICPTCDSTGHRLSIPMPGHPIAPNQYQSTLEDFKKLENLIDEHDVLFLLTDTRESRWLPSVIGASKHKIIINCALGFDTFLVQRHGVRFRCDNDVDKQSSRYEDFKTFVENCPENDEIILMGNQLGCYFCNDVFAPGNSTRDRTLDQQCTVTRPGLSMIAAGHAVELLMSILQHPAGRLAPAIVHSSGNNDTYSPEDSCQKSHSELYEPESILGTIPHQIRGFLSRFEQIRPGFGAFNSCTACSFAVIDQYRNNGFNFLLQVCEDSSILENITGLKELHEYDFEGEDGIEYFD